MSRAIKVKRYGSKRHSCRKKIDNINRGWQHYALRRRTGVGTYTGTPDSEIIANYIENFQYNPEKRKEVLKRFAHLVQP